MAGGVAGGYDADRLAAAEAEEGGLQSVFEEEELLLSSEDEEDFEDEDAEGEEGEEEEEDGDEATEGTHGVSAWDCLCVGHSAPLYAAYVCAQ